MNEQQIHAVLKTAECGSITRAAQELFSSSQGIKEQIDALESELGCTLFIRSSKGCTLTPSGEVFCQQAPELLGFISEFVRNVKNAENDRRELRVSAYYSKEIPVIDSICSRYSEKYPHDEIVFVPLTTPRLFSDISDGKADIGFFVNDSSIVGNDDLAFSECGIIMGYRCVMSEKTSKTLAIDPAEGLSLRDLLEQKVAIAGSQVLDVFHNFPFKRSLSFERYEIISWIMHEGICICDEYLAQTLPSLVSCPLRNSQVEIVIGHRKNPSIQVRRFIETAKETTGKARASARKDDGRLSVRTHTSE
jgi:DNA-binding transcriptional LysR family regulator